MDQDPLTHEQLQEIKDRWSGQHDATYDEAVRDVKTLVQEIERLHSRGVAC